jgi:hypothetical protein
MSLMQRIRAKQKADAEKAEARLEKRRGYARAARERAQAANGLDDLPIEVAVAIEQQLSATPEPEPEPPKPDASVGELVARLEAIKDRIFWLAAVWANTLSSDVRHEAERFRAIFRELDGQLRAQDPAAADRIIEEHEALLLAEPDPAKPRVSLAVQQWFELMGEVRNTRTVRAEPKPDGYVPDGLQAFL